MSIGPDPDPKDEDEYDEEVDSDFQAEGAESEDISSSSDDETAAVGDQRKLHKKQKIEGPKQDDVAFELDSGDEATIKEHKKAKRKQRKTGRGVEGVEEDQDLEWRAKTRAMRERDREEKKRSRLANIEGSTIDVEKAWAEMNRPGPLPPVKVAGAEPVAATNREDESAAVEVKENISALHGAEMITIKRKFKFAGEVHVEEKVVPKSSAEARLWLSQQEEKSQPITDDGVVIQRPLRKISRFDPNYNNIAAFKVNWSRSDLKDEPFKGPKLNVVEKSKMDWASHVDAEGLKDELDEHAKAKEGYHGRMDFLNEVEQRKEEEARQARIKR